MACTMFYLISDDEQVIASTRALAQNFGLTVQVFSQSEWQARLNDPSLRVGLAGGDLAAEEPVNQGAKILAFPGTENSHAPSEASPVKTIHQIEGVAIENAIFEYNGNLTEAAKALGIGRATLYRKVKQYNIDPSLARRKRAA